MRGDQCKFDHGNDAVVLEDAAGVPPYQPVGITPAYTGKSHRLHLITEVYTRIVTFSVTVSEPYVPAGSSVPLPPLNVPPPGYQPTPSTAYPLANAPPAAIPRKRSYDPTLEDTAYPPNKMSAFSRLGPAAATRGGFRGRGGRGSKQLAVRNIPPQVNNIAHLNNHFAKFGNLVNVQIQFEGDPASALVTFSNKEEAEGAFTSAEAVLGNRFIKMYYHYERPTPVPMRGGFHSGRSVKERLSLGAQPTDGSEKVKKLGKITSQFSYYLVMLILFVRRSSMRAKSSPKPYQISRKRLKKRSRLKLSKSLKKRL